MPQAKPADIQKLRDWNRVAKVAYVIHYTCGILGGAASAYVVTSYPFAKVAAIGSTICFVVLGFVQPMKTYHKFMSAARVLQHAVYLYEENLIDIKELIETRLKAEMLIQRFDEQTLNNDKKS